MGCLQDLQQRIAIHQLLITKSYIKNADLYSVKENVNLPGLFSCPLNMLKSCAIQHIYCLPIVFY